MFLIKAVTKFAKFLKVIIAQFADLLLLAEKDLNAAPLRVVHLYLLQPLRQRLDARFRLARQARGSALTNPEFKIDSYVVNNEHYYNNTITEGINRYK